MQVPKVKVEVTLSDFEWNSKDPKMVAKSLSFVCEISEAERVFRAACDAAVKERENGEEEKVGGRRS